MATFRFGHETKLIIFSIIVIAAAILLVRFGAEITGFATSDVKFFQTQGANFVVDSNSESTLTLVNLPANYTITSFKMAGLLSGDGYARVYLKGDDGSKYLIISDSYAKSHARNFITGFAVKGNGQGNGQGNQGGGNDGNQGNGNDNGNNGGDGNNGQGNGNGQGNSNGNNAGGNNDNDKGNSGRGAEKSWHSTPKKNKAATFYSAVDDREEQKQQAKKYNFELGCQDSCNLPKGALTGRAVSLVFEVSNAELKINNVQYMFVPYQMNISSGGNQTDGENGNTNNETAGNSTTVNPPANETQSNQTTVGNETQNGNNTNSNNSSTGSGNIITAQASSSGSGSTIFSSSGAAAEERSEGTFSKPAPPAQSQQGTAESGTGQQETSGAGEGLTSAAAGLVSREFIGAGGISGMSVFSAERNEAVKSWIWILASVAILFYILLKNVNVKRFFPKRRR